MSKKIFNDNSVALKKDIRGKVYNSLQEVLADDLLVREQGVEVKVLVDGVVKKYGWFESNLNNEGLKEITQELETDSSLAYHSEGLLGSNITNVEQQLIVSTLNLTFPIDIPYEHDYAELYGVFITGIGELPRNFYYVQEDSISIMDYTNELLTITPEKFYITIKGSKFIQ